MAWEILMDGPQVAHRPHHDLESLFYVLIWICVNYIGPRGKKRADWDIFKKAEPLGRWVDPYKDFKEVAEIKFGQFGPDMAFERQILGLFSDYFHELRPCCTDLRGIFFTPGMKGPDVIHAQFLSILEKTVDNLAVEDLKDDFTSDDSSYISIDPFTPIVSRTPGSISSTEQLSGKNEDISSNSLDDEDDEDDGDQPPRKKIATGSSPRD
jgi:hypothetical protein